MIEHKINLQYVSLSPLLVGQHYRPNYSYPLCLPTDLGWLLKVKYSTIVVPSLILKKVTPYCFVHKTGMVRPQMLEKLNENFFLNSISE